MKKKFDKKALFLMTVIVAISAFQFFSARLYSIGPSSKKIDFYGGIEKAPLRLLDYDDVLERCERQKWNEQCYRWLYNDKRMKSWSENERLKAFHSYKAIRVFNCHNDGWLYRMLIGIGLDEPYIDTKILVPDLKRFCMEASCGIACEALATSIRYSASKIEVVQAILWYYLYEKYEELKVTYPTGTQELERLRISRESFILFAKRVNTEELNNYLHEDELKELTHKHYDRPGDF